MSVDETTTQEFTADDAIMEMLQNDGLVQPEEGNDDEVEEQEAEQDSYEDVEPEESEDAEGYEGGEEQETGEEGEEQSANSDNFIEINGENIPLDELKAGYQRQSDYTRKTQELAEQRKALAALEGLGNILATDPQKAAQIGAIMRGEQPQQQQAQDVPPDDPIEAMKWEMRREILQELAPQLQQVNSQTEQLARAQQQEVFLSTFKQDPEFSAAMQELNAMVAEKMAKEGKYAADVYYSQLDNDQGVFAEEFQKAKKRLTAKKGAGKRVPKQKGSPALANARSGSGTKTNKQKAKQRELAALKSGDADAIFDVVASSGGFGDLFGNKE